MYRSTPHSATRVSPVELLFGRTNGIKLAQLQDFTREDEVRDCDRERKEKGKMYADCKRNAAKMTFQKVTNCYSSGREPICCQHHLNKNLLQLFRKMETVFSLRLMV